MSRILLPSLTLLFCLTGCATMAKDDVRKELIAICASKGENMRVSGFQTSSKGGMWGTVMASGDCLAPGEPGYEEAIPVEDLQAD